MPNDGGGETATTTTQNVSEPSAEAKPYLTDIYKQAQTWQQGPTPQYFPGQTLAPTNTAQTTARQGIMDRANAGSPLLDAAKGYVGDTLAGNMDDALFRNVESKIKPSVNANFSMAGRYGSGAHTDSMTRGLTESYAPIAAGQMQFATQAAPSLAAADYADWDRLAAAGSEQQGDEQARINSEIEKWNFGQSRDINKLQTYSDLITGVSRPYGQTTETQTQTQPGVPMWQQLLSVPFAAAGAGGNLGWWGR